jgi:hypothetical protein
MFLIFLRSPVFNVRSRTGSWFDLVRLVVDAVVPEIVRRLQGHAASERRTRWQARMVNTRGLVPIDFLV